MAMAMENETMNPVFELAQGITAEEMKAVFFDAEALIEPAYKVWQINSKGHRYYYRYDEQGEPEFFPSVTTILSQTMPTPPHLIKWIADKGYDEAEAYKQERAYYGTFMHAQFEKLIINREYDLDGLKSELLKFMEVNKLPETFIYYADDLKKDVLAFAQFVIDYDVRPLAVEIALVHPIHGYAGMIDLPCVMRKTRKSEEYINAIVDFKSGRKGFFEEHEIQLHLYKEMWNANFEGKPITKVFNFSPKDWRKKPTYNLKDQTDSPNALKIPYLLEIAKIEDVKRDNVFTHVSGFINLNAEEKNLENNVVTLSLAELIKSKQTKEDAPSEEAPQAEDTPRIKQFKDLKAKHPDALLLFRCGESYEAHHEDAEKVAKVLKLQSHESENGLTTSFPYTALDTSLPKLTRAGYRVAICDTIEKPKQTIKRGGEPKETAEPVEAPKKKRGRPKKTAE